MGMFGICGGFQMLGRAIHDPLGIEGESGSGVGLGLLNMETTLHSQKQLANVSVRLAFADAEVQGYEIHAGISEGVALRRPCCILQGQPEGAVSEDGQVIGSYLHGLFDSASACDSLLEWAGLCGAKSLDMEAERGINRLADAMEAELDIERIVSILG